MAMTVVLACWVRPCNKVLTEPLAGAGWVVVRRSGCSLEQRNLAVWGGAAARMATFITEPSPWASRGAKCWMLADSPTSKLTH